jgi:hypothetical protein
LPPCRAEPAQSFLPVNGGFGSAVAVARDYDALAQRQKFAPFLVQRFERGSCPARLRRRTAACADDLSRAAAVAPGRGHAFSETICAPAGAHGPRELPTEIGWRGIFQFQLLGLTDGGSR